MCLPPSPGIRNYYHPFTTRLSIGFLFSGLAPYPALLESLKPGYGGSSTNLVFLVLKAYHTKASLLSK